MSRPAPVLAPAHGDRQHQDDLLVPPSMLERLLKPHPNCLAIVIGRGGRLSSNSWFPVINLVWLFWVFAAPWFGNSFKWSQLLITYASVLPFLWLYLSAWYRDRRHLQRLTAALAAFALISVPVIQSWSYIIYASVLLMYERPPRTALMLLGAYMAAFVALSLVNGWPLLGTGGAVLTCAAISLINLFFIIDARHDHALRLTQAEVRRLAASAERERIGRDLHDLLGHTLSLIAIKSELADRLFERDPVAARRELRELHTVARDSLAQVRTAVTGIRATGLAAEQVSARLLLESSNVALSGIEPIGPLPAEIDAALAMCLREAVTNIHRHANARQVQLELRQEPGQIELRVTDDGCGGVDPRRYGNGLQGMQQRLAALGGSLVVDSPAGRGTTLRLRLPQAQPTAVSAQARVSDAAPMPQPAAAVITHEPG